MVVAFIDAPEVTFIDSAEKAIDNWEPIMHNRCDVQEKCRMAAELFAPHLDFMNADFDLLQTLSDEFFYFDDEANTWLRSRLTLAVHG